ncbi:MAG: hypothetical protein KIT11_08305 [Fimbriimonadaceae bacterium]|nr:hypothetical protein [Fimbriimonadaceae bacterium]QYK56355.1 MAG: hypothetical protein KF733_02500 [Fimbriimonadaceae bacterium]
MAPILFLFLSLDSPGATFSAPAFLGPRDVECLWVTSRVQLDLSRAAYETTTLFHNPGEKPVKGTLQFQADRRSCWPGTTPKMRVGDHEVTLQHNEGTAAYSAPIEMKAKSWVPVRCAASFRVQRSGPDGVERCVAFRIPAQSRPLTDFQFSISYKPGVVFQVVETIPRRGWEIGAKGAYIRQRRLDAAEGATVSFRYYPAGFERIGDDGSVR